MMILKKSENPKAKRSMIWLIQHYPVRSHRPGQTVTDSRGRAYKVMPAGNLKRV